MTYQTCIIRYWVMIGWAHGWQGGCYLASCVYVSWINSCYARVVYSCWEGGEGGMMTNISMNERLKAARRIVVASATIQSFANNCIRFFIFFSLFFFFFFIFLLHDEHRYMLMELLLLTTSHTQIDGCSWQRRQSKTKARWGEISRPEISSLTR